MTTDRVMNGKRWLFCDFHIHTTQSDGAHPVEYVVDLYGNNGFDVIAITTTSLTVRPPGSYGMSTIGFGLLLPIDSTITCTSSGTRGSALEALQYAADSRHGNHQ